MQIDIAHIARRSRLAIEEDKLPKFQSQMESIITMVEQLPPMEDAGIGLDPEHPMQLRKDEVKPSMKRDEKHKNAPQMQAGCVVVPKTVE